MVRLFILLLPISLFAESASLYNLGEQLYFEKGCNSCHGVDAKGSGEYPYLANRSQGFLAKRLRQYRSEKVLTPESEMMIPFAKHLSDKQIDALSYYLYHHEDAEGGYRNDIDSFEGIGS